MLEAEILRVTDHFTEELFDLGAEADRLVFPVSRLLVDPERFADDNDEPMALRGMGAVYVRTHNGKPLKTDERREELMAEFYYPHHQALETWTQDKVQCNGHCLIIDAHSFPCNPLPCDRDQFGDRPDFCVGTSPFHTPPQLVLTVKASLEAMGYRVWIDKPYSGTIVPMSAFGKDARVASIMIEVNRRLYMNEESGERSPEFGAVRQVSTQTLEHLVAHA